MSFAPGALWRREVVNREMPIELVPLPAFSMNEVEVTFTVDIRKLTPDDDPAAVTQVYVDTWKEAYRGIVEQDYLDALTGDEWAASLERRMDRTWIACYYGKIVGVCAYGPARDEAFAGWGELVSLYVLPEQSDTGIGSRLLRAALKSLCDEGFEQMYLWVFEENSHARAFYERQGFTRQGNAVEIEVGGSSLHKVRYVRELEALLLP